MPHTRSSPCARRLRWQAIFSLAALFLLLRLPCAQAQEKDAADYFVHSLPGAPEPLLKMHAGHIEVTPEHHGNMFFWLFKNRHISNKQRTLLWLNGGPGCSSMDGALMEIGPYRVNEDGTLRYNNGSWDEFANLLFVDNPVGTGFSYVDGDSLVHGLHEMAAQMITFLEKWFEIFPEYMHDELFIAGESYAGMHIPYIAQAILDRNADKPADQQWNVAGLLIGNGWFYGPDQYFSYLPLAYETGILEPNSPAGENARAQEELCLKNLNAGGKDKVDTYPCELIMHALNRDLLDSGHCYNVYDVRLTDTYPSCGMNWPPDLAQLTPYLRRDDVLKALHINPDKHEGWTECNGQVGGAFRQVNDGPSKHLLPGLLEQMPIILFAGDKDLICNHIGVEAVVDNLEFNGGKGISSGAVRAWTVDGESAGTWQTARNLTYIRFYDSSHMVPFDYPRRTRDMFDRFTGVDFAHGGGHPITSHLDGEKEEANKPSTPNRPSKPASTTAPASPEEKEKISAATWLAYRRSGEAALVVVLIAAGVWGFFVWRGRRRRRGYKGVLSSDPYEDGPPGGAGVRRREAADIEAAAAFDEAELDELTANGHHKDEGERFGLADDEDEEEDVGRANGRAG